MQASYLVLTTFAMVFMKFSFFEINFSKFRQASIGSWKQQNSKVCKLGWKSYGNRFLSCILNSWGELCIKDANCKQTNSLIFQGRNKMLTWLVCLLALEFGRDEWQIFGISNSADLVFMLFVTSELQGYISFPQ